MNTGERTDLVKVSKELAETPPNIDPVTEGAISFHELCRSLAEVHPMYLAPLTETLKSLQQELQDKLLAMGEKVEGGPRPIPTVEPDAITDSNFIEFVRSPCPVIFKGFAKDTAAVRNWTPAFFGERYGSFPCVLASETDWNIQATLGDAVDDILTGKESARYAHNIANIFNEHPDLEAQLELERFLPYLGQGRHLGTHLFIGGSKTGTAYHCASNLNVFYNIYGEKDWFFVHPKYAFWMYGFMQRHGGAAESPIDHHKSARAQAEKFPLFQQVPVYTARLTPGDVLINPPWWWHAINNLTNATIACAVRWQPQAKQRDPNLVYSLAQRLFPHSREVMKVLRDPKARITDELYRERFQIIQTDK